MTKNLKIAIAVGLVAGAGLYVIRRMNFDRRLKKEAEDGYETAGDVLFPGKTVRNRNLRYGPVLPKE
ncbi:MAG: hypothetical protein H7Y42_13395 [Chitinophagaceae bacterium]|nr:hypothetical protein [Chitinophagaceae bacterium]